MKALLFLLFPILEFYLLVRAGTEFGALNIVLWCIITAFLGGWVVKGHGISVLQRMQSQLLQGVQPQDSMLSAVLVFFAGVMFILPGFITDALGLLLLLPPVRQAVGAVLARQAATQRQSGSSRVFFFRSGPSGAQYRGGPIREEPNLHNTEAPRQVTVIDCTPVDEHSGGGRGSGGTNGREPDPDAEEEIIFDCDASPPDEIRGEDSRTGGIAGKKTSAGGGNGEVGE